MNLYRSESSNPKWNAQRNLCGRTHYVDDDTLRFHKSRVISSHVTGTYDARGGLLFAIVTSDALTMDGSKRGFRYAIFDVFGTCFERPTLEEAYSTSEKARKAMWAVVNGIDAKAHTLKAIDEQERAHKREMETLRLTVRKLGKEIA